MKTPLSSKYYAKSFIVQLIAFLVFSSTAGAVPIFEQTPQTPGIGSAVSDSDGDNLILDDFSLSSADTVRAVTWFGGYDGAGTPGADEFEIWFYDDNGSGAPLSNAFQNFNVSATRTLTGNTFSGSVAEYRYEANIGELALSGGTTNHTVVGNPTITAGQDLTHAKVEWNITHQQATDLSTFFIVVDGIPVDGDPGPSGAAPINVSGALSGPHLASILNSDPSFQQYLTASWQDDILTVTHTTGGSATSLTNYDLKTSWGGTLWSVNHTPGQDATAPKSIFTSIDDAQAAILSTFDIEVDGSPISSIDVSSATSANDLVTILNNVFTAQSLPLIASHDGASTLTITHTTAGSASTLSNPVLYDAGEPVRYYISIVNGTPSDLDDDWVWEYHSTNPGDAVWSRPNQEVPWSETIEANMAFILHNSEFETAPIPEPATMLLLGSGLVGLAGFRRKKFKK